MSSGKPVDVRGTPYNIPSTGTGGHRRRGQLAVPFAPRLGAYVSPGSRISEDSDMPRRTDHQFDLRVGIGDFRAYDEPSQEVVSF